MAANNKTQMVPSHYNSTVIGSEVSSPPFSDYSSAKNQGGYVIVVVCLFVCLFVCVSVC